MLIQVDLLQQISSCIAVVHIGGTGPSLDIASPQLQFLCMLYRPRQSRPVRLPRPGPPLPVSRPSPSLLLKDKDGLTLRMARFLACQMPFLACRLRGCTKDLREGLLLAFLPSIPLRCAYCVNLPDSYNTKSCLGQASIFGSRIYVSGPLPRAPLPLPPPHPTTHARTCMPACQTPP